jgi:hypothetical protein
MKIELNMIIDIDEANEKSMPCYDKEHGEGAYIRDFTSSIFDLVQDELPTGVTVESHSYKIL